MTDAAVADLLEVADDSPEAILALYEARGWGDGLPLIPPTLRRFLFHLEQLSGTARLARRLAREWEAALVSAK